MISTSTKGGEVVIEFAQSLRTYPMKPNTAVELAEKLARLSFKLKNGVEPPTTRSVLAGEIRRRVKGEIRDELVAKGVAALRKELEGGQGHDQVIEAVVDHILARIT